MARCRCDRPLRPFIEAARLVCPCCMLTSVECLCSEDGSLEECGHHVRARQRAEHLPQPLHPAPVERMAAVRGRAEPEPHQVDEPIPFWARLWQLVGHGE